MEQLPPIVLHEIPLKAIGERSLAVLKNLNKIKVITSEEGFPRDYRGLADLARLNLPEGENQTAELISEWKNPRHIQQERVPTLGLLMQFLERLDRWDIIDDVQDFILQDARDYLDSARGVLDNFNDSVRDDYEELTDDDIRRSMQGFPPQLYDALILFAEEDSRHAIEMYDKLKDYGLKVCLRQNLLAGLPFEHEAIMRIISNRCRRVIIIISRNFLQDRENAFYTLFSQSLSIQTGNRIIIPCIYDVKGIQLPPAINSIFKLDYNRVSLDRYDYWQKLHDAIVQPPRPSNEKVVIREIQSAEKQEKAVLREIKNSEQDNENNAKYEDCVKSDKSLSIQESIKSPQSVDCDHSSNKNSKKKTKLLTQIMTKILPMSEKNKKKDKKLALES